MHHGTLAPLAVNVSGTLIVVIIVVVLAMFGLFYLISGRRP
jgi:hypothetical protein